MVANKTAKSRPKRLFPRAARAGRRPAAALRRNHGIYERGNRLSTRRHDFRHFVI